MTTALSNREQAEAEAGVAKDPPPRTPENRVYVYGSRIAAWALPFTLVVYLGLEGGGYDSIVRGEVGIAIWWIVLLGAAIGILPAAPLRLAGWLGIGLLSAFAAWTGLGIAWSGSSGASFTEFARVITYLGVFALVLVARRPGDTQRLINGLAAGMTAIAIIAVLSRIHPSWFSTDETSQFLATRNRLSYPLDYWNGLAALMAMAVPLLLAAAASARTIAGRAAAAAALPVVSLAAFFTLSRGGAVEVGVAVAVLLALAPRRLALMPTLAGAAAGCALLIGAAIQRDPLSNGLSTATAHQQGDEMLTMTMIVCSGVALVQVAIAVAAQRGIGPIIRVPRPVARRAGVVAGVVAVVLAVGVGGPGYLSQRWDDFKRPASTNIGVARFDSSSGSGRYQTWSEAIDANATSPWIGIGPGTYENWWAKDRPLPLFARDAHSLYLETLGELGIIGFVLVSGFVIAVLGFGARRSLRGAPERRWPYAAATASAAAFAAAAGIDWVWELSVLPVAFMVLAGGVLASRRYRPPREREGVMTRAALVLGGLVALVAITIPLLGAESLRDSQNAARAGDLSAALDKADHAHSLQPYDAAPALQQALVLELMNDNEKARSAALEATRADSENWRAWLVLSRLEAKIGESAESVSAYRRAASLNPKSPLFANG